MPSKSVVSVDLAVNSLLKYIKYFNTDKLPEHSSRVWQDISNDLKGLWKVPAVRINVRQDRRKILTLAREKCGYFIRGSENIPCSSNNSITINSLNKCDSDDNNEKNDEFVHSVSHNDDECKDFNVTITREQWNLMKHDKPFVYKGRKYHGFKPGVWTNIVSLAFWEQYRLKCAFVFKRGKINKSGVNYAVMNGRCKDRSCLNFVRGIIKDPPSDEGPVVITMRCRDTRFSEHADVKRPLNGFKRKEVQQKLLRSGVVGWRKEEAKNILKHGDTRSPFLYNSGTLQQARKEAIDKKIGIHPDDRSDMILDIRKMNQDPQNMNSILWISDTPFFVFYATPTQFHTYAEYLRVHKQYSSIFITATGGLVKKLTDSHDKKTGYIFLYQIVINFDGTSIPVYQMLSEKHSASFISFWLSEWAEKVDLPQQAVSDGPRTLLNAMSIAFNGKSLKDYINFVFESVITNANLQPRTYIRLDTAHFLHAVSKWKCFQSALHSEIVKSFFVYCVALMIDCDELSKLEEIFMMILIVCNTEFDDSIIAMGDRMITPEEARKNLEELVAKRNPDLTIIDSLDKNVDPDKTVIFDELSSKATDDKECPVAVLTWIDSLCKKVNTIIFIGQKLNTHYVPDLYTDIVDKMKDFPLWTNVCTPKTMSRPNYCSVETDFKDLKMNLGKKVKLPTTVNNFLKLHIADIIGGVNIFRSKLTKFETGNCSNENAKSMEENLFENWKGFGKKDHGNLSETDEQNYLLIVLEKPIDLAMNTNLSGNKTDQNDSLTTVKIYDDHNYSSSTFQEQNKNSNRNTSICIKEMDNSSDAGLSSKYNNMQNDSVISLENDNDISYHRGFYDDKNHCLNISISDVENDISLDAGLLNTVSDFVIITSSDTID